RADYRHSFNLEDDLEQLQQSLATLKQSISLDNSDKEEDYHTLKQVEQYLYRQLQKAAMIRNAVLNRKTFEEHNTSTSPHADSELHTEDLPQFITPNPLNWNSLASNFSFESSYFRYALRTAVTAVCGYALAYFLGFKNAYWVLRSEEHTSELQSRFDIVCRLLLEKNNNI